MNIKQISIGALISYISLFVNIIIGLLYTPWMIDSIGQSQYGLYTLANSLISLFLIDFGLSSAIGRFVSNYHADGKQEKVNNILGLSFKLYVVIDIVIFSILVVSFLLIGKVYVNLTNSELHQLKIVYIIIAVYGLISFPFMPLNGVLTAYGEFVQVKFTDLMYRVFLSVLVVFALSLNLGLYSIVVLNALVGMFVIGYKIIIIKRKTPILLNIKYKNFELTKEIFSFSFWITVAGLAQRLIFTIIPSILGVVADSKEIAIFGVISTIEGYIYSITTAINGMFMPVISKEYTKNKEDLASRITPLLESVGKYNFATNALLVVGFILVGKDFVILWVGKEYISVYWGVIAVIIPGMFFNPLQIANTAMIINNKVRYQALIALFTGIINVILSLCLSPKHGAIGASMSILIAYSFRLITYLIFHKRIMKFNMKRFITRCYLKMLPCVVIPLILYPQIENLFNTNNWIDLTLKSTIVVILFLISLLFCFDRKELEIMRNKFRNVFFDQKSE